MPKQKDLKRLVRSRMHKTGESYTAARRHLIARNQPSTSSTSVVPRVAAAEFATIAGVRDETVRDRTGKTWAGWVKVLDAAGAMQLTHAEIARHVKTHDTVSAWWAQSITVGYERIRGLRDVGQRRGGTYDANKSRTFPVSVSELYRAFAQARVRRKWLPVDLKIRTSTRETSMRITWDDGSSVDAYFTAKGPAKSTVAIQHRGLPSKAASDAAKVAWAERFGELGKLLK